MTWVVLLVPPDKYLSFQSVPTPVFFFPPHWPVSHLTFTECPLSRLPQLVLQNKSLFFLRFFFVVFFFFYHQIAPLKMRKTEPWTKSEIHYRGWLRRRRPDKSKLQISFDARKEQLNIYKTAGKKKKRRLFLWFLSGESAVSPGPFSSQSVHSLPVQTPLAFMSPLKTCQEFLSVKLKNISALIYSAAENLHWTSLYC